MVEDFGWKAMMWGREKADQVYSMFDTAVAGTV